MGVKCVASLPSHFHIDCDFLDSSSFARVAEMCHVT